jgi:hypothetical protein
MTTTTTPEWAIAKIRNIPADIFFSKLGERMKRAQAAYRLAHQAFTLTHLPTFRDTARHYAAQIRRYRAIIIANANLYYLVVGYDPEKGWPKGMSLN